MTVTIFHLNKPHSLLQWKYLLLYMHDFFSVQTLFFNLQEKINVQIIARNLGVLYQIDISVYRQATFN